MIFLCTEKKGKALSKIPFTINYGVERMNKKGLYDPAFEHDSCGIGFVVNVNGEPCHRIVEDGITILKNLVHRGAVGGDVLTGDGAGLLLQIPHKFFLKESRIIGFDLPETGRYGAGMIFLPQGKSP